MDKLNLKADQRKVTGRKVKSLREEGILPGVIFGKDVKSENIKLDEKDFEKVFSKAGETSIVEISLGKSKRPTLIKNVQKDPVNGKFLHVDFLQVDLKKKVSAQIPLELVGESPAEKQGLGTVVQYLDEIEVEALPTDLLEKFEIDASKLEEVDQAIYVKDLKVDKSKMEVKEEEDTLLVKVEPPQKEEEPEPEVSAEGEEGEEVEGKPGEEEKGAEGESTEKGEEAKESGDKKSTEE